MIEYTILNRRLEKHKITASSLTEAKKLATKIFAFGTGTVWIRRTTDEKLVARRDFDKWI